MKPQLKKSNMKPNKERSTAGTTEAEAEKEKEKKAVAWTEKAVAETDTRETAPKVHQADANTAAAKGKPVTTRCNAHSPKTTTK